MLAPEPPTLGTVSVVPLFQHPASRAVVTEIRLRVTGCHSGGLTCHPLSLFLGHPFHLLLFPD